MRRSAIAPVLLALAMLSSCGGSTSGGQTGGTPTPGGGVPAPTPTPTPSPTGGTASSYQSIAPNPTSSVSFQVAGYHGFSYDGDAATGLVLTNARTSGASPIVRFRYDQNTQTYTLITFEPVRQEEQYVLASASPSSLNASLSDSRFAAYLDPTTPAGITNILRLFRSGSGNPDLQLSYCGFGNLTGRGPNGFLNFFSGWFGYGVETRSADIPTTIRSGYTGVLHGFAVDPVAGKQYRIEGNTRLTIDFASRVISGTVDLVLVAPDGTRTSGGTATLSEAMLARYFDGTPAPFSGSLTGPSLPFGTLQANLYGPGGGEVCGVLSGRMELPATGLSMIMHGAIGVVANR